MQKSAFTQLSAYFEGTRREFTFPFDLNGSDFERRVWDAVSNVPFGETRTYQQIAQAINQPGAARAVGLANARNRCLLVIPCHRIIGASGKLTGYAGGLQRKQKLIQHEQRVSGLVLF